MTATACDQSGGAEAATTTPRLRIVMKPTGHQKVNGIDEVLINATTDTSAVIVHYTNHVEDNPKAQPYDGEGAKR